MIENKKASILLVLKVLEDYSDEEHFLTHQNIIDYIDKNYGITLERKSIAYSLNLLEELGYDINKSPKGGFALFSRQFEPSEITFLYDAIFTSKSLSGSDAKALLEKINKPLSIYQRKRYNYLYKSEEINRTDSKQIFLVLDTIEEAIKQKKRMSFEYITYDEKGNKILRKNGFRYIVSPYYTINNFGKYYLIANYREKYRPLQIFRIEYMVNPKIEEEWDYKKMSSLKEVKNFDISKFINDNLYILDGQVITAKIEILNKNDIKTVVDFFAQNATFKKENKKLYATIKCNENALFYFLMQYTESFIVISPSSLIERMKKEAKKLLELYK